VRAVSYPHKDEVWLDEVLRSGPCGSRRCNVARWKATTDVQLVCQTGERMSVLFVVCCGGGLFSTEFLCI
jgi:hypothetical protein